MSLLSGNALVTGAGKFMDRPSTASSYSLLTQHVGSGIGRQLSLAYVRTGVTGITLADRNEEGLAETARLVQTEFPHAKVLSVVLDVTDEQSVNAMVDKTIEAFGALDYGKRTPVTSGHT